MQDLDTQIIDAQSPITRLEEEHSERQRDLNSRIAQAQQQARDLNMSADRVEDINKSVERFTLLPYS